MQVTVSTVAVDLLAHGERFTVQNLGPADVWLGDDAVTPATGVLLAAGMQIDRTARYGTSPAYPLWAVTAADTADLRMIEA